MMGRNWFSICLLLLMLFPLMGVSRNSEHPHISSRSINLSGGVVGSDQTICAGSTPATLFNISPASGGTAALSYQWQSSADSINFSNIPSAALVNFSPSALGVTTYFRRRATDGTLEAFSNVIKITVNAIPPSPSITAMSSTSFCAGEAVQLTVGEADTYQWFNGGQLIAGATSQTISVTTSGNYAVTVKNKGGCSSSSPSTAVIANPLPAIPTITPGSATRFCLGQTVTLTAPAASAYQWYSNGEMIAGATDQNYTASVSGSFAVTVTNQFGCTATSSSTTVTVNPLPAEPSINAGGVTTFCLGGTVVLTSSAATTYQWFKDGTLVTGAVGAAYTATSAGDYSIRVKNSFGCESSFSNTIGVTTRALPATPSVVADGPASFCQGGSVLLTSSPGTSYQWLKDGTAITTATSQTVSVSVGGAYAVVVTNADGCKSETSSSTTVSVNPLPARPVITAAGPIAFCDGGTVKLTSTPATSYQWYKDGVELTGTTSQTYTTGEKGSYTVIVKNATGCTSAVSSATVVVVNPVPTAPLAIVGAVNVFAGATQIYSVADVAGATSYTWTLPSGWTGSSTSNTITVTVGTAGGVLSVKANINTCSSGTVSLTLAILPDNDKDAVADDVDLDDDNDGIPDLVENAACSPASPACDTDGDGIPNRFDLDSDADRIPDVWEAGGTDDNNDGRADGAVSASGIPASALSGLTPPDTDRDGKLDPYDVDSNGDGIPDGETLLVWKTAKAPRLSPDGSMELTYSIVLVNARKEPITNVQVKEDLTKTFPSPLGFSVVGVTASGALVKATGFDGRSSVNLLQTGTVLPGLARDSISVLVRVAPNGFKGDVLNTVDGYAEARWFTVERQSIDINRSNGRFHGAGLPTVVALPEVKILIPDVITPNNDGLNDRFIIQRPSNVKVGLMMFNNKGTQVYKTEDYRNTWDGTSTSGSRGNLLPSGTYYYVAEFSGGDIAGKEVRKGFLTLKRD